MGLHFLRTSVDHAHQPWTSRATASPNPAQGRGSSRPVPAYALGSRPACTCERAPPASPALVTAHRGLFPGVAPEHTLAAFQAAIDLGCDWIELDTVRLSPGVGRWW
jgi:glycerophosphoryl diester phosphodiesterase